MTPEPSTVPARLVAMLTATVVILSVLVVVPATPATAGAEPAATVAPAARSAADQDQRAAVPAARRYDPAPGVLFNNPYGDDEAKFRIFRHIVRSIDAVPSGEKIRVAAWNLRSPRMAGALLDAHRRGVSVRVVVDELNATAGNPNQDIDNLMRRLREGNRKRTPDMKSWLRKCRSACRSPRGIAHTKFYAFSKVGRKSRDVVIYGSANATTLSATIQWNDVYTIEGWPRVYDDWIRVFNEMGRDTWVRPPLRQYRYARDVALSYYAYTGPKAESQGDPTLNVLNGIRCQGATGGTGTNGRTKIRVAQTAMHGDRGKMLANRLIQMKRRGCDIRFVYAMFGGDVVKSMRRAGIGMTHLAHDSNDDGIYDRYVHMKAMSISGVYRGNTAARIVWNGSANWTSTALASDEVVGEIRRPWVARQYMQWIDRLYVSRPRSWNQRTTGSGEMSAEEAERRTLAIAAERGVDPYALIKAEN